jgi:hypothetical protein
MGAEDNRCGRRRYEKPDSPGAYSAGDGGVRQAASGAAPRLTRLPRYGFFGERSAKTFSRSRGSWKASATRVM